IGVEGYDTSLEPIDLYRALESLFKTCGEVHNMEIRRDRVTKALQKSCIVILRGEGAGDKALQLNGSDIGGRKIVVTSLPPGLDLSTGIGVEGYSTSLKPIDLFRALESLFKICGEVHNIQIRRDPVTNALQRSCIVILRGEGAGDKALQLNGSDIGGSKIVVTSLPPELSELSTGLSTDVLAARSVYISITVYVTGYDTSLSEIDTESAMRKHFSSCGEIIEVDISKSSAELAIDGEDAQGKVMELDGSDMGGANYLLRSLMETLASKVDLLNLSPMDSSRIRIIGLALDDPRTLPLKTKIRNVGRIIVKGYDAKLPHDDVESALRKVFSSCGEINDIFICETEYRLYSDAIIYFIGEGAAEKALQLSGSDVGGWKPIVTPYPFPETAGRSLIVCVTGYDNSLSKIKIERALRQHFSSCGRLRDFDISKKFASAEFGIVGEDAQDKVMELDGSDMGGREIHVKVTSGAVTAVHTRRYRSIPNRRACKVQRC
ncbi:unnamed protein product, partial [Brassica rapa subsp. trilocularis]